MKIDLHCHTKAIKSGEPQTRNVDLELFKNKILASGVQIVAITNHNDFDLAQYQSFSDAVKSECHVWPGIELDIVSIENEEIYHLIIIANPKNADEFHKIVLSITKGMDKESFSLRAKDIVESFKKIDVIYVPHFHKKPSIPESDRQQLISLVGEARVFYETSNYRSMVVYTNNNFNTLIGSDIQNWAKYEQSKFTELRLPVSSFEKFCQLAERDSTVVGDLLDTKTSFNLAAYPHKDNRIQLKIFSEMNIVFGQKGTGKTKILESLKTSLEEQGQTCEIYSGANKENEFEQLKNIEDIAQDVEKVKANSCVHEFKYLRDWNDSQLTSIKKYIKWFDEKDKSANKKKNKLLNARRETMPKMEDRQISDDLENIKSGINVLSKINTAEYLSSTDITQLETILAKLKNQIHNKLIEKIIAINIIKLYNFSIERLKNIAKKHTGTESRPSTTGFQEFALNRIRLRNDTIKIILNLKVSENQDTQLIGTIDEKGDIFVSTRYRMICDSSDKNEFPQKKGRLLKAKNILTEVITDFYKPDVIQKISKFNEMAADIGINSTSDFLGVSKLIITSDGQEYNPSTGEKGILMLQHKLKSNASAFILDEPDSGMGNSYIDGIIRPQVANLAKEGKIVIIATHNANLAVRTLPYQTIYRTHASGKYKTYLGNPFTDALVNIDDSTDVKSWTHESITTLEGGKEAFNDRRTIYESGNN